MDEEGLVRIIQDLGYKIGRRSWKGMTEITGEPGEELRPLPDDVHFGVEIGERLSSRAILIWHKSGEVKIINNNTLLVAALLLQGDRLRDGELLSNPELAKLATRFDHSKIQQPRVIHIDAEDFEVQLANALEELVLDD